MSDRALLACSLWLVGVYGAISQLARPAAAAEAPKIANKIEVLSTVRINPPSSRKHCAWPAAAHLGDGHIVVAYCDSVDHQQTAGGKLMVTESRNWGRTWAEPRQVLGGLPWHYSTTPPIWIRPDGALELNVWAWRKRRDNERLTTASYPKKTVDLFMLHSSNKGRTWQKAGPVPGTGDPLFRANDVAWCYGQVRTLKDGTLVRPAWGPSPKSDMRLSMRIENAACLRSENGGQSWQGYLMLDGAPGKDRFNETDILALADGRLLAVIRNDSGKPYRLYSRDGGRTWDGATPIPFVMKCPALHVLADGHILLLCRSKDEKGYGFFAYHVGMTIIGNIIEPTGPHPLGRAGQLLDVFAGCARFLTFSCYPPRCGASCAGRSWRPVPARSSRSARSVRNRSACERGERGACQTAGIVLSSALRAT